MSTDSYWPLPPEQPSSVSPSPIRRRFNRAFILSSAPMAEWRTRLPLLLSDEPRRLRIVAAAQELLRTEMSLATILPRVLGPYLQEAPPNQIGSTAFMTAVMTRPISVVLTIDAEPDLPWPPLDKPDPWLGFEAWLEYAPELRGRLERVRAGQPASPWRCAWTSR